MNKKIAIIIPCYNEEKRLKIQSLNSLLKEADVDIFLANDGSSDDTLNIIKKFSEENLGRCFIINFSKNQGKANTIYKSVNEIIDLNKYIYIGYFDADFSTPVSEMVRMMTSLNWKENSFLIGSRVLLLNTKIKRKWTRHIIGRSIVTLINLKFNLGIYDTQCGAKFFSTTLAKECFYKPFKTSWLFDIEIFIRLKKKKLLYCGKEFPLNEWCDVDGSKLGWKTSFKILNELFQLFKTY
jgi:dolichyl-phosphate beta-glucosyltransferase